MPKPHTRLSNSVRGINKFGLAFAIVSVAACATQPPLPTEVDVHTHADVESRIAHKMPPGSNEMLRALIAQSDDLEVIISDVVNPAGASVPKHFHPGQEFRYVIERSAIHREEGQPDQTLNVGDAYVIPPRAVHNPMGGPKGARAIVFRVHQKGNPERILVNE